MPIKKYFFGKECIIDRALEKRENLIKILGQDVAFVNQVHGKEVVVIDQNYTLQNKKPLPKADALVTNLAHVSIGVITADCSPILLCDEEAGVIAAAHAGWRGAKLGIIEATIAAMQKLGAKNIQAEIGPMIQQESYEVSQEFLDDFIVEERGNQVFFKQGVAFDKYLFDLPAYVEHKLGAVGISHIKNAGIDTYQNEQDFFSFRRATHQNQSDCGRNVSVIVKG